MNDVTIVGGGIAGLVSSVLLADSGLNVTLIEKRTYPSHKVCGEYVSNEVIPFLEANDLFPEELNPSRIDKLWLSATNGKVAKMQLDLGAFGISRYRFDEFLHDKAIAAGVLMITGETVSNITYQDQLFEVETNGNDSFQSKLVIGAYGKRSNLDKVLDRKFIAKKSPYLAVKYHIRTDLPEDVIALHNFQNGYCGVSRIENGMYNLCYLSHRDNLKKFGNIPTLESDLLSKNPHLKYIFENSDFLFEKPEVINEISFESKPSVENHVLMTGDAAGMIAPLSGNGMAMAVHSSKILTETIGRFWNAGRPNLKELERVYASAWANKFNKRLKNGRKLQKLFGSSRLSKLAVFGINNFGPLANYIVKKTHGESF